MNKKSLLFALLPFLLLIQTVAAEPMFPKEGLVAIGIGLAIGLAGLGAGIGMGTVGASACAAICEKPEIASKTILYIVFIEAIAIYAFVISVMMIPVVVGG